MEWRVNPFPNDKFSTPENWKSLQMTIFNLLVKAEISQKKKTKEKTLWEKENLLIS